ncbi:hypothetical protein [Methylomonas albis]|uniref:GLPGLI family protein n=1 Tax=Methylomonas albis TaxID=1854563 RepID=A0ABR9D655_9GAMM|nr:hypothetical protein [Methylomonas albis]MBD9358607.1 hypothetical protein [Methylomonas albis]
MNQFNRLILLYILTSNAFAQSSLEQLNSTVFDGVIQKNYIKTNKITQQGVISACEIEFQAAYRDFRALSGSPVVLMGSFSILYFKDKSVITPTLKLVPAIMNFEHMNWDIVYPPYGEIFIGGNGLEKYKATDFKCENGGKCTGYNDSGMKIIGIVAEQHPFDGEIKISLKEGGMDSSILLSSISPEPESTQQRKKFTECILELISQAMSDLEHVIKK